MLKDITNIDVTNIKVTIHKKEHKKILYSWLNDVSREFSYHHITFLTSILILEKYTDKYVYLLSDYQLIGISSLYIAAKIEETKTKPIEAYAKVTDETFSKEQIHKMEMQILDYLNYDINSILPGTLFKNFDVIEMLRKNNVSLTNESKLHLLTAIIVDFCLSKKIKFTEIMCKSLANLQQNLNNKQISSNIKMIIRENYELIKFFNIKANA
ncbi:ccnb2 [Ecytonucleospora hepatopenaei]|uniref:Ccnb2 n=1 Tax=Ecytonucleospora hepatopenaei TaxID=646526 RepID=A0A1W0E633_9MICR|nr:ccnb2 [Ecytonucleospora hepatopenaei]